MRQLVSVAGVVPDRWVYLSELADPHDAVTHLIVPWSEWQKSPGDWPNRAGHIGVSVLPDTSFSALQPSLDRIELVVIAFPGVSEGRGYSLARQLRERGQYCGELRAAGEIFRDHVLFLARCGFDSFEISARESPEGAFAALQSFTVAYQPVRTDPQSIALKRRLL
jgi:uncharacterized protein (DUF934 family)